MSHPLYCRSPRAVWRASRSFLVVRAPDNELRTISGSAAAVWEQLVRPVTLDEVVEQLAALMTVSADEVRSGTAALLEWLVELGVVEVDA